MNRLFCTYGRFIHIPDGHFVYCRFLRVAYILRIAPSAFRMVTFTLACARTERPIFSPKAVLYPSAEVLKSVQGDCRVPNLWISETAVARRNYCLEGGSIAYARAYISPKAPPSFLWIGRVPQGYRPTFIVWQGNGKAYGFHGLMSGGGHHRATQQGRAVCGDTPTSLVHVSCCSASLSGVPR